MTAITIASAKTILNTANHTLRTGVLVTSLIALQLPVVIGQAAENAQAKLLGLK